MMAKTNTAQAAKESCITVPLAKLDIDPMNVRRTDVAPSASFIASIEAEGIKEPLLVRVDGRGSMYLAYGGGRRVRALRIMRETKRSAAGVPVTDDFRVPVVVENVDDRRAREISLAMNIHRADMHPVDKFEAFADLMESGSETPATIALRHGMTEHAVKQALALGALSLKVRSAWRAGKIDAKTAQAFTLASSHAGQDKLFAQLDKANHLQEWAVARALNVTDEETGALMEFVGDDTYVAAGGKVTRDLFNSTRAIVSDPAALKELANAKLANACETLIADGWAWAIIKPPHFHGFRDKVKAVFTPEEEARLAEIKTQRDKYQQREDADTPYDAAADDADLNLEMEENAINEAAELRSASAKFRKAHGCMVLVSEHGKLAVEYGYKELPKKAADRAGPALSGAAADAYDRTMGKQKAKKTAAGTISNALNQRLSEQLTAAAEVVMRRSPQVAMAALIAGAHSQDKYVDIKVHGLALKKRPTNARVSFTNTFEAMMKAKEPEVESELCGLVARALDFQEFNADVSPMKRKETAAVCNALDPKEMLAAIAKAFDAADYFANVSASIRKQAVTEAMGEVPAVVAKMKSDAQAKWCTTNLPPTGWLPAQLRTEHYKPPAKGAKVAPTPAKKAAKKKAKKKSS